MAYAAVALPCFVSFRSTASRPRRKPNSKNEQNRNRGRRLPLPNSNTHTAKIISTAGFGSQKREPLWQCVQNCGACCKLDKGPAFPSPEEIFDGPSDVEHFKSLIGPDGWCIHFDRATRKCSIYADRPYFCRVEPDIFQTLYGIDKRKFNKEACSSCIDTIKTIYGSNSNELDDFNHAIWCAASKTLQGMYESNEHNLVGYEVRCTFMPNTTVTVCQGNSPTPAILLRKMRT